MVDAGRRPLKAETGVRFPDQIGDKPLEHVTRDDTVAYAEWWEQRVVSDGIEIGTMNKNLGHLSSMFRAVIKRHKLRLDNPFAGLRQEGGKEGSRPPFPTAFIHDVLLTSGNLDGLNDDARDIVYPLMETGARPSELANLTRDRIKLDANIPHIRVDGQDRECDASLAAPSRQAGCRVCSAPFSRRYFDRADNFSATANKYFKKNSCCRHRNTRCIRCAIRSRID